MLPSPSHRLPQTAFQRGQEEVIITAAQQFISKGKSYFRVSAVLTNSGRRKKKKKAGRDGSVKYLWHVLVSDLTNYNTLSIFNLIYQSECLLPI